MEAEPPKVRPAEMQTPLVSVQPEDADDRRHAAGPARCLRGHSSEVCQGAFRLEDAIRVLPLSLYRLGREQLLTGPTFRL